MASVPGSPVVAAASGEVTFAGQVAGVMWVVVRASPWVSISHGRLATIATDSGAPLAAGRWVQAGDRIGTASSTTYLGAKSGGDPVDPWPALSGRAHLVRPGGGSVGCGTPQMAPPRWRRLAPG